MAYFEVDACSGRNVAELFEAAVVGVIGSLPSPSDAVQLARRGVRIGKLTLSDSAYRRSLFRFGGGLECPSKPSALIGSAQPLWRAPVQQRVEADISAAIQLGGFPPMTDAPPPVPRHYVAVPKCDDPPQAEEARAERP